MFTEYGKRVLIVGIVAGIAYYVAGPCGVAVVALILLLRRNKKQIE